MKEFVERLSFREKKLPVIIVTGASGFIGRHFLESFKHDFYIHAIARRSQRAAGVEVHNNINWIRLDIREEEMVNNVFEEIARKGGADYVLHLAGYYDFTNKFYPEYQRTNITGTKFILEACCKLKIKRFLFSSSLTISSFGKDGPVLDEKSPPDADFPYAWSKKEGEKLLKHYSDKFPCTVIRCAAIFSDWCEYGPLYILLTNWFSGRWDAHVLPGSGAAAIPYLHTRNLNSLLYRIISNTQYLPPFAIYVASHDGCNSQKELHDLGTRYNFGQPAKTHFIPNWFAWIGVVSLNLLGMLRGKRPFIRPWMLKYTDTVMDVNAAQTRKSLGWKPVERFHIRRRLLFLIENMKSNPYEWKRKNEEALHERSVTRPNLQIYEVMVNREEEIINDVLLRIKEPENENQFRNYVKLTDRELKFRFRNLYKILKTAVVLGDRLHVLSYARTLAVERFKEQFEVVEVSNAIRLVAELIVSYLKAEDTLKNLEQRIHDEIMLTVQLVVDELEDSYDRLSGIS